MKHLSTTALVGEADTCQLSVGFTYHSHGPIYEASARSMEFDGNREPHPALNF